MWFRVYYINTLRAGGRKQGSNPRRWLARKNGTGYGNLAQTADGNISVL